MSALVACSSFSSSVMTTPISACASCGGRAFERAKRSRNPMHRPGADAKLLSRREYAFPGPQLALDALFELRSNLRP